MGLSGRKEKQRIPNDPRNLSWADNATKFGQTYLSKFGWDPSKGLGTTGDGRTSHIKVAQKLDMLGIGSAHTNDPNGIAWKQNKEFEALLKRLNDGLEQDETTDVKDENLAAEHVGEEQEKKRKRTEQIEDGAEQIKRKKKSPQPEEENVAQVVVAHQPSTVAAVRVTASRPMAHRARNRASKNLASKSAAAISEILGIAPTAPADLTTSQLPGTLTQIDDEPTLEKLTTSTRSMADYFKDRLREKNGESSAPTSPDSSAEDGKDESYDAPRGGLGSSRLTVEKKDDKITKMGLGMSKFESLMSGAFMASLAAPVDPTKETGDKITEDEAEKKAQRKAEKKAKREAKVTSIKLDGPSDEEEDAAKTRRKQEKRAKKEHRLKKQGSDGSAIIKTVDEEARRRQKAERRTAKARQDV